MLSLLPYQSEAVEWLCARKRGLLAFDPGLGKTFTAMAAVERLGCGLVLAVAPASVLAVWRDEMARTYGRELRLARGARASRLADYAWAAAREPGGPPRWLAVSYEALRSDIRELRALAFDALIYDETLKIQNHAAKMTKAALSLTAPVRIALNGTPVSNSWADLWPVCTWLDRDSLYGNFYRFRRIHAVMNPYYPAIEGWRDTEGIRARVAPLVFSRKKTDVLRDLPPCVEQTVGFPLSAEEAAEYRRVKKELRVRIMGEEMPVSNALVLLGRLRQVTAGLFTLAGPPYTGGGSTKIRAALDLLESVPAGEKCVVFSGSLPVVEALVSAFPGQAEAVTGATPPEIRDEIVRRFAGEGGPRFLVGTDAMSVGLNLQRASYLLNVDLPWSFARYDQRRSRCWRMGQGKPVTVWNLEAEGTVDAHVRKVLERKIGDADEFSGVTRRDIEEIVS